MGGVIGSMRTFGVRGRLVRGVVLVAAGVLVFAVAACASGRGPAGPVQRLAVAPPSAIPLVAADGSGAFDAIWGASNGVWTDHWSPGTKRWRGPVRVWRDSTAETSTEIADSASGATVIAWTYLLQNGAHSSYPVYVAYRPPGGAWQPPVRLSPAVGAVLRAGGVGIDASGNAYVTWTPKGQRILLAEHPATARAWSAPDTVAVPGRHGIMSGPDLSVGPAVASAIAWSRVTSSCQSSTWPSRHRVEA
jgi:hypothetical protein